MLMGVTLAIAGQAFKVLLRDCGAGGFKKINGCARFLDPTCGQKDDPVCDSACEADFMRGQHDLLPTFGEFPDDIQHLCSRMLIIDHGQLLYDGSVEAIRQRFGGERTLVVDLDGDQADDVPLVAPGAVQVRADGPRRWLQFQRDQTSAAALIGNVSAAYRVRDLTLEEPDIEGIVRRIYEAGTLSARPSTDQ